MKCLIVLFTLVVLNLNSIHGNIESPFTTKYRECGTKEKPCTSCLENENPCRFENAETSYYGCIEKGQEFHCCPVGSAGYSYNNNTQDVTCIENDEELNGHGVKEEKIDNTDWKFCSDLEYPSCRNRETHHHTCTHISKPCNGECYPGYEIDASKKVCAKSNEFIPSFSFQACSTGNTCPCNANQQPCRFNGYPGQNYQGCIQIGDETNCCPPGFKYNPNSLDVTCIGENEQLLNGIENGDWRWCHDSEYPSCREKVEHEKESKSLYKHTCRGPNHECPHDKFFPGGTEQNCGATVKPAFNGFCLRTGTCKPGKLGSGWTCKNNNNKNKNVSDHDLSKRFGEIDEPEVTNATVAADDTKTIIIPSSVGAAFLLLAVIIGGVVYYKRRQRHNVERVDDNPDYDYGEIYDNIEVTDFNPYYMENGEDEEDGKAEIVDHNPLYGVGEDED